jgi:hypothetical protein
MDLPIQLLPNDRGRRRYGEAEREPGLGQSLDNGCKLAPIEIVGRNRFWYRLVLFQLFDLPTLLLMAQLEGLQETYREW